MAGKTQLSDPNLPIDVGGAPTKRTSEKFLLQKGDCLHKRTNFIFLAKILFGRGAQSGDVFLNFFCLSAFGSDAVPSSICVVTSSILP
jgi:hypothetical protein